jgi:hypothetical protein
MAITMNGQTFRTLDDELYLNGQRIVAAHADGTLVYPETTRHVARISGSYSYGASHTHMGDAGGDPILPCSVSNSLSLSYTGTFYTQYSEDPLTVQPGFMGWDKADDGISSYIYRDMEQYGYKYVASLQTNVPPAPIGTNQTEETLRRRSGRYVEPIGAMSVDIEMTTPQFCQPLRVYKSGKFGKVTSRFASDMVSKISGHYEIQQDQWRSWSDGSISHRIVDNRDEYAVISVSMLGTVVSLVIWANVEATTQWEYLRTYQSGAYVVTPISESEDTTFLYGFGSAVSSYSPAANFYAPVTNIEDLY